MGGRIERALALLILTLIREINQAFARLAARISAGTYLPSRPVAARRARENRTPRGPNKLSQTFAGLVKLLPETAAYGTQLHVLFAEPEMAAPLAPAPAATRRPLRSLCRMLGARPSKILAAPAKPRAPTAPTTEYGREPADRPAPTRKRAKRPPRVRYVFGLRDPPPFPNPA